MSRALPSWWDEPSSESKEASAAARVFGPERTGERARRDAKLDAEAIELVAQAEGLGLPWKRILSEEVVAETILRRFLGDDLRALPLWRLVATLPAAPLRSWRVRERVDRLAWECSQGSRRAKQELTQLHATLTGGAVRRRRRDSSLATHQWLAYQRVLELRAICELVPRVPAGVDPIEFFVRSLGCSRNDARWAAENGDVRSRFYALERAMRHARSEGFEIPQAANEREAFLRLRASVRRNGFLQKRAPSRRRRSPVAGHPAR